MGVPSNNPFLRDPANNPPQPGYTPPRYSSEDLARQRGGEAPLPPVEDVINYTSTNSARAPEPQRAKPGDIIDVDGQGNPVRAAPPTHRAPEPKVVNYHENTIIGLDKCTRCGSADMTYNIEKNSLICESCRFEDHGNNVADRFGHADNIAGLEGRTITSGAQRIISTEVQLSIQCQGCGAEVVVDTDKSLGARCHWCRQTLSVNNQIPNGAVPDGIIPFRVNKLTAVEAVRKFVKSRRLFANTQFKKEFKPDNVFGVYLPYVIADAKFTGGLKGEAQEHVKSYTEGGKNNKTTYYDYNEFEVSRELAVLADDLHLEASSKRQIETASNTNNIINAVLPYPIEDTVEFRAHYLNGFNSERRDMDVTDLDQKLVDQMLTVLRAKADETVQHYSKRGVRWDNEWTNLIGVHQASIYVPVWLYTFVEPNAKNPRTKKRGPLIHYIAVNGITGKTMGSIPIAWGKLYSTSWFIGLIVGGPTLWLFLLLHGMAPIWW